MAGLIPLDELNSIDFLSSHLVMAMGILKTPKPTKTKGKALQVY